jgi:hypothetical protein
MSTRKKIFLFFSALVVLALIFGYIFRYSLILEFQYSRLQSLRCDNNQTNCLKRIWVHRVNTTGRYNLLKDKFQGFETDLVYSDSARLFYVYHPPFTRDTDTLSLRRFLKSTDPGQKKFWFDTRFVAASNMAAALTDFSSADESGKLKKNCILELYDLQAAEFFAQNGYIVSYNADKQLLQQMTVNQRVTDSIINRLSQVKYVSQESQHVPLLKKLFPGKQILTWNSKFANFFDTKPLQQLLDDPGVAIILVNIKSRYYR